MSGAIPPASWPAAKRAVCLEYPDTPEWTALVTGVLIQLSFGYYWDKNYTNWEDARNAGNEILQSWFAQTRCDAGAIPVSEPQCVDYPNNSPLLDWEPANPFTAPGDIPPGYIAQPWGVVPNPPVFPYQIGDVISGLFGLPVLTPAISQGLARVRIKFNGRGTVEIHIIKVALGGIALLTWDDNPLTARFIDTSMDFLAIPPESGDEDIQEVSFETDGDHHIDVTMLPRFDASVGFAGYGGGIRKVVLCGPDIKRTDEPGQTFDGMDFFDSPENGGKPMALCESVRWQNGVLQAWCCGEWQDVPGQPSQGIGGPGQPGGGTPQPQPGGGQTCYHGQFPATGSWLVPTVVNAGDTVVLSNATGAGQDGILGPWKCPNGQTFFAGQCIGIAGPVGSDPLPTANHMELLFYIDGTYYSAMGGPVTVPGGVSNAEVLVVVNDSTTTDNSGSYSFDVCVTNNAVMSWSHEWLGGHGVVGLALPPAAGVYGSYDFANDRILGEDTGPGVCYRAAWVSVDIPMAATITAVEFHTDDSSGCSTPVVGLATDANSADSCNLYASSVPTGAASHIWNWTGSQAIASRLRIFDSNYASAGTDVHITYIKVSGTGPDPF